MPRVTTTVVVPRPPAEVFDFLSDARNLARWSSGVAGIDPAAVVPGRNAEYRYRYPGRHRMHRLVCTVYEPFSSLAFRGQRMWTPLGTQVPEFAFGLLPDDGGTQLRLSVDSTLTAGLVLFHPVVAMAWRRDLPVDACKLCEVLLAGPVAPPLPPPPPAAGPTLSTFESAQPLPPADGRARPPVPNAPSGASGR